MLHLWQFVRCISHGLGYRLSPTHPLNSRKSSRSLSRARDNQTKRDDDPKRIHENIIANKISKLGARVLNAPDDILERASRVVQHISIKLAEADDGLQRVTQRVVMDNEPGTEEG